jgi:hypothetical protein
VPVVGAQPAGPVETQVAAADSGSQYPNLYSSWTDRRFVDLVETGIDGSVEA